MTGTAGAFLLEPLIALLAVGLLMAIGRWAHAPARPRPAGSVPGHDFGLLVPVVTVDTPAEITRLRAALWARGIRSTWVTAPAGPIRIDAAGNIIARPRDRRHVLVFGTDANRAARALVNLLGSRQPPT
ncbi:MULTISPECIES: hypothetical protein [unclassified Frankia]